MSATFELELKDIHKSFLQNGKTIPVLNGIDLNIRRGELAAIVGPSGCGKTTLFNIIAGILNYDSGQIYLRGERVRNLKGLVGYMQQKDLLFPWRTLLKNVLIGPELRGESLKEAEKEALELLEEFGLGGFENFYPDELSGGMRQRGALVRTILLRKDILLLDEPFGALDAMTRRVMQELLLKIKGKYSKTILLVTHDIEEALFLSERVYVLTARPARVKDVIDVPLPYPRDISSQDFVNLKMKILGEVHEEMEAVFNGTKEI